MQALPHYRTVGEMIAASKPCYPVMCFCPEIFRAEARRFARGFPGAVHYAVKANPFPGVVHWLSEGGVKGFDVASIGEIEMVRQELGDVHLAFNHPVKSRADIETAHRKYSVGEFVIDHDKELAKLADICDRGTTVQVRVARANPDSEVDLNAKFGCDGQAATLLMRHAADLGFDVAVAMHVGWQAKDPRAWTEAMAMAAGCAEAAGVKLKYANLGGGYPSVMMPAARKLEDFFEVITGAKSSYLPGTDLNCEPGSALVWKGAVTLAQVHLRKDVAVYINDGVYGAMAELKYTRAAPPVAVFDGEGKSMTGPSKPFTVFGPTCDSVDTLPAQIHLPETIDEGDYVAFGWMGAYSNAIRTDFNSLGQLSYVQVDEFPFDV